MAVNGSGFDSTRLDGVLALLDSKARAAAEDELRRQSREEQASVPAPPACYTRSTSRSIGRCRGCCRRRPRGWAAHAWQPSVMETVTAALARRVLGDNTEATRTVGSDEIRARGIEGIKFLNLQVDDKKDEGSGVVDGFCPLSCICGERERGCSILDGACEVVMTLVSTDSFMHVTG
uniref:Uncharacterized protein n=1 Tax=Oryza barthii TaxID=65489 RepID=A0A0D3EV81_9ORYZ